LQPLGNFQLEALEEATAAYSAAVTEEVLQWWLDRGITEETVVTSRLGVVDDPYPGHHKFAGWLTFPYLSAQGQPLQIRFRCPWDHDHVGHGKYMTLTDDPPRTYNIRSLFEAGDEIHVTEGEIDALTLNQIGLPAVGIPGVHNWTSRHPRILAGFSKVWIWGDPDDAGAGFISTITSQMRTAKGVRLREYDVNKSYVKYGAEYLLDLVRG
jgi:DNA primase